MEEQSKQSVPFLDLRFLVNSDDVSAMFFDCEKPRASTIGRFGEIDIFPFVQGRGVAALGGRDYDRD